MSGDRSSRRDLFARWLDPLRLGAQRGSAKRPGAAPDSDAVLRPPGALEPDERFLEACTGCGDCAPVCPVDCIQMLDVPDQPAAASAEAAAAVTAGDRDAGSSASDHTERSASQPRRLPAIVPAVSPCRLCTDLPCVAACPEGALVDPGGPRRVRIGVAQVDPRRCVTFAGEICTICFKACPYPNQAISLIGTRPLVSRSACTGCGLCEWACPERPKAIVVSPERSLVPGLRVPRSPDRPSHPGT